MNIRVFAAFAALAGVASSVHAAQQPSLEQLKEQLQEIKQNYRQRIDTLESRITELEQQQDRPVVASRATQGAQAFNPAISVILNGKLNAYDLDPDAYALPGFQLGGEAGLAAEGLALDESELVLSGNIDDRYFGRLTAALHSEDGATEVELEEAFVEALGLPGGLGLRAGRFFSDIGYLNSRHPHAWDFADAPLAYRAFLGENYFDDGVQLRWLAPTDLFVEAGGEWLRGATFPAGGGANEGKGVGTVFIHAGGDVGTSHTWRVGLSRLWASDAHRDTGGGHSHGTGGPEASVFDGDSNLTIADVVWKWAPNGNAYRRNLTLQAEYFRRNEDGMISVDDGAQTSTYTGDQSGWYAQAVYQFIPRWRIGTRYDRLWSSNSGTDSAVLAEAGLLANGHEPQRYSIMLDHARSEYSRWRLQYNRDESRPEADNQWTLQYIMSLGAHGAHRF